MNMCFSGWTVTSNLTIILLCWIRLDLYMFLFFIGKLLSSLKELDYDFMPKSGT